jgi:hypothetical protein
MVISHPGNCALDGVLRARAKDERIEITVDEKGNYCCKDDTKWIHWLRAMQITIPDPEWHFWDLLGNILGLGLPNPCIYLLRIQSHTPD